MARIAGQGLDAVPLRMRSCSMHFPFYSEKAPLRPGPAYSLLYVYDMSPLTRLLKKLFVGIPTYLVAFLCYAKDNKKQRLMQRFINRVLRKEPIMADKILKNIEFEKALEMAALVAYQEGQIVSRTLVQNKAVSITLFAFDTGEEISSHESQGDALVYILDGSASITVGGKVRAVQAGQTIVMPAGVPHALEATSPFKMLLVVAFPV